MESPTHTVSKDLSFLDSRILLRLKPFDLGGKITRERDAVGTGASCDVFRGVYIMPGRGEVSAALKRMRMYTGKEACKVLFEREIYVWSTLQHSNVLPLLGFAFDDETGYPMLISEWMDNGNALAYVRQTNPGPSTLLKLILDIANGLTYLHDDKGVVHSDIKPVRRGLHVSRYQAYQNKENVLIRPDGHAMLCDFGCARMELPSQSLVGLSSTLKGTCNYWAPELLLPPARGTKAPMHSKMTDVWAFGMTVYAISTGRLPFRSTSDLETIFAITRGPLPRFSEDVLPNQYMHELIPICLVCWNRSPHARPQMSAITRSLSTLHQLQIDNNIPPLSFGPGPSLSRVIAPIIKEMSYADPFGKFLRIQCGDGHFQTKEDQLNAINEEELACYELDGFSRIFFASAEHGGTMQPCKASEKTLPMACVPFGGVEHYASRFTILRFNKDLMELVPGSGPRCIPDGRRPVLGGKDVGGEDLYHVVADVNGMQIPGKAARHIPGAHVSFDGREFHGFQNYKILCWKD